MFESKLVDPDTFRHPVGVLTALCGASSYNHLNLTQKTQNAAVRIASRTKSRGSQYHCPAVPVSTGCPFPKGSSTNSSISRTKACVKLLSYDAGTCFSEQSVLFFRSSSLCILMRVSGFGETPLPPKNNNNNKQTKNKNKTRQTKQTREKTALEKDHFAMSHTLSGTGFQIRFMKQKT